MASLVALGGATSAAAAASAPAISASTLMTAATVIGTAGTLISGFQQGRMADYNARLAEQQAAAERSKAKLEEARHRRKVEKLKGTQRAMFAKAGVTMEGSPLLVMEETAAEGELDAMLIRAGGEARAAELYGEASLSRMRGRQRRTAGVMGAGTTLLTDLGRRFQ